MNWKTINFLLAPSLTFLAACGKPEPMEEAPTPSVQQIRMERAAKVPAEVQKRWTYLNRLRQDDAFSDSIARTMVNDRNQLGVVLYARVTPEQIPSLLQDILADMAQEFPQQSMTLVAYKEGKPPLEMGTAQLEGATAAVTYLPKN